MIQYEFYFDAIQAKLFRAAAWRQSVADRYPDDTRNAAAIRELTRLAKSRFGDVTQDTWATASSVLESATFIEALHMAVRDVGFRSQPDDINAFIRSVVKVAPFAQVAA